MAGGLNSPEFERRCLVTELSAAAACPGRPWGGVPAGGGCWGAGAGLQGHGGGSGPGSGEKGGSAGLGCCCCCCLFWWSGAWHADPSPRSNTLISSPPGPGSPQFDTRARFRAPYSRGQAAGRLLGLYVRACVRGPLWRLAPPFYAAPAPLFPRSSPVESFKGLLVKFSCVPAPGRPVGVGVRSSGLGE